MPGGHRENFDDYTLAVFKAQLGEPFLGIVIFVSLIFQFFSSIESKTGT